MTDNSASLTLWYQNKGDETCLLDYPLNGDSTVIEVGGYEGAWAEKISALYNPNILLFEPVYKFYKASVERFRNNPKVVCYNTGLSDFTGPIDFVVDADGSRPGSGETVSMCHVRDVINSYVDLVSINIEGGEYTLLPEMLNSGIIKFCRHLQVQFHDHPNGVELRDHIREGLAATHQQTFNYPFVWEGWRLK